MNLSFWEMSVPEFSFIHLPELNFALIKAAVKGAMSGTECVGILTLLREGAVDSDRLSQAAVIGGSAAFLLERDKRAKEADAAKG